MKKFAPFVMIALIAGCLLMSACGKDAELNAFITDLNTTVESMVKKIDSDPTIDGINAAQKIFDEKKGLLKKQWDSVKDVMGYQVTATTKQNLQDAVVNNRKALNDALLKNVNKIAKDEVATTKLQNLIKEYEDMFGIPPPKDAPSQTPSPAR
jgi:hypothetical protein